MSKKKICHISSVHLALDTRLFYRFCLSSLPYYDVSLIAVHPKEENLQGVHIVPFRRFKNKVLRVLVTWIIMFFKALKMRAHIYHVHDPELIPCALLLKLFGKKVVFDLHENVAEDIFDKPWISHKKLLYSFFSFFENLAVRYLYLFLAEKSYAERYKKKGARYEIVMNYHNPEFFKNYSQTQREGNRIFYIGILLESRGLLEIAEAIYILKMRGNHVYFDVVGELYTDLAKKLHQSPFYSAIKGQIVFHGRMSLEDGYEISRQAAIGMCIIHPMKNSVGSYPTKMFEYMAIGLPQITSHFELYKSVVETHACGICVDPMQPEAIAGAIDSLLGNAALSEEMAMRGLHASTQYAWDSQFEKALAVYRAL